MKTEPVNKWPQKSGQGISASIFPQVQCALSAAIGFFITGSVGGWTGSAMTKLDKDFKMGPTEYSIVGAIISYGSLLGCCITGKAMDSLGRRKVLLATAPLAACGWAVIGFATNVYMVYIGRFVCGLTSGIFLTSCPIYASETCQAQLRGRIGMISTIFLSSGTFSAFLIGGLFTWQTSAFIFCIPSTILFINLCLVPESPYWYLLKGDTLSASESLTRLRGSQHDTEKELAEMSRKISDVGASVSFRELFKRRTRIPLTVSIFMQTMQQFCPGNIISIFSSSLFERANSSLNPHLATIYLGVVMVLGTTLSIFIIDKYGRKILLILSVSLSGIFCLIFGGYFLAMKSENPWPTWTPLLILILFTFSFCLGCSSIPWLIGSEIFNTSVRSRANAVAVFYNRILSVLTIEMYPYLAVGLGEATVFLSYGVLCVLFTIGTVLFVPETKGKSLEEIQEYFEHKAARKKEGKEKEISSTQF